ncbi:MAG: hypothetical protein ACYTDY_15635 [Planctomycetota bacterium]|jgi:hypothetical protein
MVAALGNMKAAGIEIPEKTLKKALTYCRRMCDGRGGMGYGTRNPSPDFSLTRGAGLFIGMHLLGNKSDPYGKAKASLKKMVPEVFKGHGLPPLHYFNAALANHLAGSYPAFRKHWAKKLVKKQREDGGIFLENEEGDHYEADTLKHDFVSTSVLAMILNLDRGHLFAAKPAGKDRKSPFRRKPKKKKK